MSVDYIEEFTIGGVRYGIEDYQSPGNHFFPKDAKLRYNLWMGGCGIGIASTIDEARKLLWHYAVSQTRAEKAGLEDRLAKATTTLAKLGDDPFNLGLFR